MLRLVSFRSESNGSIMKQELLLFWVLLAGSLPAPCQAKSMAHGPGPGLRTERRGIASPQDTRSSCAVVDPNFRGHAFGQGIYVGVGAGRLVQTSTDGMSWTQRDSGTPFSLCAIAYGKGLFVAVGNEGVVLTSPDSIHWTSRDTKTDERLRSIVFGGDLFVAVGYDGTIITSLDGIRWNLRKSGTVVRLQAIVYGKRKFVTVGWNGIILFSRDGRRWAQGKSATTLH